LPPPVGAWEIRKIVRVIAREIELMRRRKDGQAAFAGLGDERPPPNRERRIFELFVDGRRHDQAKVTGIAGAAPREGIAIAADSDEPQIVNDRRARLIG
jgi:hypothetical protein